jgi:hypothetical protein
LHFPATANGGKRLCKRFNSPLFAHVCTADNHQRTYGMAIPHLCSREHRNPKIACRDTPVSLEKYELARRSEKKSRDTEANESSRGSEIDIFGGISFYTRSIYCIFSNHVPSVLGSRSINVLRKPKKVCSQSEVSLD